VRKPLRQSRADDHRRDHDRDAGSHSASAHIVLRGATLVVVLDSTPYG
jgi:hypothetical protein